MQFTDIKNQVYILTKTNSSSFPVADLTLLANNAMSRVSSMILQADGRWEFDDTNYTDLPIGTTALVSGQSDYELSTDHLEITDVEIKDSNGNWYPLKPIDKKDAEDVALTEFYENSGSPMYYDVMGKSVFLYPAPNYSQAASLKVFYKRTPSYFTTADTTKTPGFATIFHDLIPLWVSYEYSIANGLKNSNLLMAEIDRKERALVSFYSHRNKDDQPIMSMRPISFR